MADLDALLTRIAARRPSLITLGLETTLAALAKLGDPHKRLPPTFHVAGTNGKGSTAAYLKAMLEAAGNRVHVFTSPHLVRYNERITLAGAEIGDDQLSDVLTRTDEAVGGRDLSFFETIATAAFLAYAETPADYLVLEVGLGGRLDATNVIDHPCASVITPIALDHQRFLGDTLAAIAREKAGIFKKGAPAVIGAQAPDAMAALTEAAEQAGAPAHLYGTDWQAYPEQGRLIYQDTDGLSDLAPPRLVGAHQFQNAGLAVAALKAAGVGISDEQMSEGLGAARWPARMQRLAEGPLVDQLSAGAADGAELWLDGGHNPHAARALANTLSQVEERASAKLYLIAGMQNNKDKKGYFDAFEGLAAGVFTVSADHEGAASADETAIAARAAGLNAEPVRDAAEGLARAITAAEGAPIRVMICGSLYLAGEILATHR